MGEPKGRQEYLAIVKALRPLLRAQGVQELEARLHVKKGYFADAEWALAKGRRKSVPFERVLEALELLNVDAGAFFWRALGRGERPGAIREFQMLAASVQVPTAARRALEGRVKAPAAAEVEIRELDELRLFEPKKALRRAENLASRISPGELALYLGVLGSCFRCCDRIPEATACLRAAFDVEIDPREHLRLHGDRLRRARVVATFVGEYRLALELIQLAHCAFSVAGDSIEAAHCLVELGTAHSKLGEFAEADAAWREAIRLLADRRTNSSHRYLCAANRGRSVVALDAGDVRGAAQLCDRAKPFASAGGHDFELRQRWLEGRVAERLGQIDVAEEHFRAVFEAFANTSPIDSALAGTELVRLLQGSGRFAEAQRAALAMCRLFGPLGRRDKVAEAALADLVRGAAAGPMLEYELVARVMREVKDAGARGIARARRLLTF